MGGRIGVRFAAHRGRLLTVAVATQLVAVLVAVGVASVGGEPVDSARRYALIALLAAAMGNQNATARRLAVPELTTTVLTMTLTGIAADSRLGGGSGSKIGRRSLAVAAMLVGGLIGALLALRIDTAAPLAAAAGVLAVAAFTAQRLSRTQAAWTRQ